MSKPLEELIDRINGEMPGSHSAGKALKCSGDSGTRIPLQKNIRVIRVIRAKKTTQQKIRLRMGG